MPTITVIVPVYNVEKYLPRCIESILAKSFKNDGMIFADDENPSSVIQIL